MSSYTTTLRRLLDPEANTAGYSFTKGHYDNGVWVPAHMEKNSAMTGFELWETGDKAYPLIFDDPTWEGYDPTYRAKLNSMITDFYWGYEIGSETPAMFKHRINAKMRLIMPYYNLLFKAEYENFKDFDPNTFKKRKDYKGGMDKDYGERKQHNKNGTKIFGDNNGDLTTRGKQYNYDTPQDIGAIGTGPTANHMSSAIAIENTTPVTYTQNGNFNFDGSISDNPTFRQESVKDSETFNNRYDTEEGYNTSRYVQYKEYLEGLKNIDDMIIEELRDCFMLVY